MEVRECLIIGVDFLMEKTLAIWLSGKRKVQKLSWS